MTESRRLKMENLIFQLNNLAMQRKEILDALWVLEQETETLRRELMDLLKKET